MKGVSNLIEIGSFLPSHECDYTHHNFSLIIFFIFYLIFFNVHIFVSLNCVMGKMAMMIEREMCFIHCEICVNSLFLIL